MYILPQFKKQNPKTQNRDFPGRPVVKNLPSKAGDAGSIPGLGTKIPHAAGQLNPCSATREAHNKDPAQPK